MEDLGAGAFAIRGDLTFETIAAVLAASQSLFAAHQRIEIDLSEVAQADSAAVALLLEWLSWARGFDRQIQYQNIPPQILAIAQISGVAELLGGERSSSQE
jgi:phospholipid transport system transporter-binding protein